MPRIDILSRQSDIEKWIKENRSKAFICRELHCKPSTLDSYLIKMGIEYRGNRGSKGWKNAPNKIDASKHLYFGSLVTASKLRKYLIRDGYKEDKCEQCGITEWLGYPNPSELHHKNGNRFDNRLENLEILCSNCHTTIERQWRN